MEELCPTCEGTGDVYVSGDAESGENWEPCPECGGCGILHNLEPE
jgi:DnaJ-class molecular chaperone